ncbi:MAG: glycosyltransferase [Thermomicrobiales bacterium]
MNSPEPMALPGVTIVIPVHNKHTITRQCVDAILAQTYAGADREIMVVDDGSRDATASMLASYGDQLHVIRGAEAQGFASACNAGVQFARNDLVVLLNNDTIPLDGWLEAMVRHMLEHPNAAVVGAKLLFPNDTIQHAGVSFGIDREPHHIYAGFPKDHPAAAKSRRFQVVTAACSLFRRDVWNELGGLDTAYKNGWEDVDYCMRAGEAGYEIRYCADAVVYHFESATRDLLSARERENRALFGSRWREKIVPDDIGYYVEDGLFDIVYGARHPIQISVSPQLAGITDGQQAREADQILYDRARQVMILLRNNIVLNVRVAEAESRMVAAEQRARVLEAQLAQTLEQFSSMAASVSAPEAEDAAIEDTQIADEAIAAAGEPVTPVEEQPAAEAGAPAAGADQQPAEPAEAPRTPSRIIGIVESPGRLPDVVTDGYLIVTGWTLTDSGTARIEALFNGEPRGVIEYGELRLDAAALYPGFPAGANCGFTGEIPVGDLGDGFHECTVRIWANDTDHAELTTTFEVDNHAFETGRVIGRIDLPVRGALFIPREVAIVSGWAMAPSGLRSIEPFIDGAPRGRIDGGALRPDIGKRRRQYPNADHCGFSGSIPMHGLEPGNHDLVVRITANDGQQLELNQRIEVEGTDAVDGGVPVLNRHYRQWLDKQALFSQPPDDTGSANPATLIFLSPLAGTTPESLSQLVEAMHDLVDDHWRLQLVDAEEADPAVRDVARLLGAGNGLAPLYPASEGDQVAQLNRALEDADAEWVAVLDPLVRLAPDAVARIRAALAAQPGTRVLYTDHDYLDTASGVRWNPFFKPDWSPDLYLAMDYLGPLVVFNRAAAIAAGGLRPEAGAAAIRDLVLRLTDDSAAVLHLPGIFATELRTAPGRDENWHLQTWDEDDRQAVSAALARRRDDARVEEGLHPGVWRVRYDIAEAPGVTAVIPTGGKLSLLKPCLDDLLHRTNYPNLDILLVDNSPGEDVANLVAELSQEHPNVRRIVDGRKPFNYSALINAAIPHVDNPLILMLNDDITVIDPDWLTAMVEQAQRPEVGIVGAKLLYPDDTIQHAGVILGPFGGSVHVFKRLPGAEPGYFDLPDAVRNYSAVTFACALIDRAVFEEIGGLDAENLPVAFNDTDFCLRTREAGYEVVYTPHAALYHHESVTKTVIAHPSEIGYLRERWAGVIRHDPYYNPNLTRQGEDARLNMEAPVGR